MSHPKTIFSLALIGILVLSACGTANDGSSRPAPTQPSLISTPTLVLATPYALEPAAGICASFDGEIVTVTLNTDMPDPRCAKVRSDQTLRVTNHTLSTLQVSIGVFNHSILPGETYSIDVPFGDYLAVGVHQLTVAPCCGAELWLENK